MRRKRTSLRRWKARCRMGRPIPRTAIVEHRLERWFVFKPVNYNVDAYIPSLRGGGWGEWEWL